MNVLNILKQYNIPFRENHPEVSNKCVGVCCPFCEENNYHLGIFKDSGNYTCWKCGTKGSFYKLLNKLVGITFPEYQNISGIFIQRDISTEKNLDEIFCKKEQLVEAKEIIPIKEYLWGTIEIAPCDMPSTIELQIDNFLVDRNFTYKMLKRYQTRYGIAGYFKQRLIIPVFDDSYNIIGLCGRDLTNTSKKKYIFNFGFKANEYLYITGEEINIPVLVEGIFDAWAVSTIKGFTGIATFGSNISDNQIYKLSYLTDEIIYMPDSDVPDSKILKTTNRMEESKLSVKILKCSEGDPCSMNRKELKTLLEGIVK